MNPEELQGQLSPDEAAASLAFATYLQEQMMMSQQEAPQTQEIAPEMPQKPQNSPQFTPKQKIEAEEENTADNNLEDVKSEISTIREKLEELLALEQKDEKGNS